MARQRKVAAVMPPVSGTLPVMSFAVCSLRQCNRELLMLHDDLVKLQKQLAQLSVPVAMLHGERDSLVPIENVSYLERELRAAGRTNFFTKRVFPDYNHFIPWEQPEAVETAIRAVLKEPSRSDEPTN